MQEYKNAKCVYTAAQNMTIFIYAHKEIYKTPFKRDAHHRHRALLLLLLLLYAHMNENA